MSKNTNVANMNAVLSSKPDTTPVTIEEMKSVVVKVDNRVRKMESRAKKIGSNLTFKGLELRPSFRCAVCRGRGKRALVFHNAKKEEVTLGRTCLKRLDIDEDEIQDKIDAMEVA